MSTWTLLDFITSYIIPSSYYSKKVELVCWLQDGASSSEDQSSEDHTTLPKSAGDSVTSLQDHDKDSDETMDTSYDEKIHPREWTVQFIFWNFMLYIRL